MKERVLLSVLFTFCILLNSCSKDDDDEDIVLMEDLSNTRIESVSIINVSPFYWDNGSSPDLYLTLSPVSNSSIVYITNQVDNVEQVPQRLDFSQSIAMTNEVWQLQLLDHDVLNSDDVIYDVLFNPHNRASNGKVPVIVDGLLLMEFNYIKQ